MRGDIVGMRVFNSVQRTAFASSDGISHPRPSKLGALSPRCLEQHAFHTWFGGCRRQLLRPVRALVIENRILWEPGSWHFSGVPLIACYDNSCARRSGEEDELQPLDVIVILGIANVEHPALDGKVFQTLDGETRIYIMPFDKAPGPGMQQPTMVSTSASDVSLFS